MQTKRYWLDYDPVALAVLLSFVLAPVASLLRPFLGKVPSVFVAVFVAGAVVFTVATIVSVAFPRLASGPMFQSPVPEL